MIIAIMQTNRAKTPAKVSWQAIGTIAFKYSEISIEIANNKFVVLRGRKWVKLERSGVVNTQSLTPSLSTSPTTRA
jgi:hypothetical protein